MDYKNALQFFSELSENNNKTWFDQHKPRYEAIKASWTTQVQSWIDAVASFEPLVAGLEAKVCVYRINRDVRFSSDKTPYKTNISAVIAPGGRKSAFAGFYIQIMPGNKSMVAGGMWMPEPEKLYKIRQEIEYHAPEFLSIIQNKAFVNTFGGLDTAEALKTVPKGFDKNSNMAPYLKYKSYLVYKEFKDAELLNGTFDKQLIPFLHLIQPLNTFLNKACELVEP